MSMFLTWSQNGIGNWKTKMPRYKIDLYIDDIFVKTYFAEGEDEEEVHYRIVDLIQEEILLDKEEIDV